MSLYHPSALLEDEFNDGKDRKTEGKENQSSERIPKDQYRSGNSFRFVCSWCAGLLVSASIMLKSLVKLPLSKERLNNGQQKGRQRSY
jgi:hypothetical protein